MIANPNQFPVATRQPVSSRSGVTSPSVRSVEIAKAADNAPPMAFVRINNDRDQTKGLALYGGCPGPTGYVFGANGARYSFTVINGSALVTSADGRQRIALPPGTSVHELYGCFVLSSAKRSVRVTILPAKEENTP